MLLSAVTLALYAPTIRHEFINFDDDEYITANPHLQHGLTWGAIKWAFSTFYASNWHPLTWISHLLDWQLYGANAAGHHFTNVLLHAANTVLLFLLLRGLTASVWRSATVAGLFAWHPLHVESVAWAAERKDVLSTLFFLLTILAYVRYAHEDAKGATPRARRSYIGSLILYALGLMAKPMLVTVPFVLLLLDFWPLQRFKKIKTSVVLEKIPFFILSAAACVVTLFAQRKAIGFADVPVLERVLNAIVAYARYVGKTIWPDPLAVIYPYYDPKNFALWQIAAAVILILSAMFLAWATRQRAPYVTVGWLWFVGTLVPVIGIVQVGPQSMADRYTYISLIGVFIAFVWGVSQLSLVKRSRATTGAATIMLLAVLMVKTHFQLDYWQNSERLFRHTVEVTSDNDIAYNNLGCAVLARGDTAQALQYFSKALAIRKDATSYLNMGCVFTQQGSPDKAVPYLQQAVKLRPDHAMSFVHLGTALAAQGSNAQAVAEFRHAIKLDDQCAEAYDALGLALTQQSSDVTPASVFQAVNKEQGSVWNGKNNWQEAAQCFSRAIELRPNYLQARLNLGNVLADAGKTKEAIQIYLALLQLNPTNINAHYNLATTYAAEQRTGDAIKEFRQTLKLDPRHAMAHNNLGSLLLDSDKPTEALEHFEAAAAIEPNAPGIHFNCGTALLRTGKTNEARAAFERALKLDPNFDEAREQLKK